MRWDEPLPKDEQERLTFRDGTPCKYQCPRRIYFHSERYRKSIEVEHGYPSDGATGAIDLDTYGWWVHDKMCDLGVWEDGSKITNRQASMVLHDILMADGHWFFARRWLIATWLFGGGEARKNGMW
jgi:hypothetical protein